MKDIKKIIKKIDKLKPIPQVTHKIMSIVEDPDSSMSQLTDAQKKGGVITHSSGNHAQAVALVGRLLGIQTTVVMPDNAPAVKRTATELRERANASLKVTSP